MDCPNCNLTNPPGAQRCDCGYDFVTGKVGKSYLSDREVASQDVKRQRTNFIGFVIMVAFCFVPFLAGLVWSSRAYAITLAVIFLAVVGPQLRRLR